MNKFLIDLNEQTIPTEPLTKQKWGFTFFSEQLNGRLAMVGFFLGVLIELVTKQNLLDFLD